MELYFAATSQIHKLDLFESRLRTIPTMLPIKTAEGKQVAQPMYAMLEPIRFYRYIFPRGHRDQILKSLGLPKKKVDDNYSAFDKQAWLLRKALNAKKIPEPEDNGAIPFLLNLDNIAIKGIGIKEEEDVTFPNGNTHEAI